ncbi:MAG: hypothetical protein PF542_01810 [Nanoarchaeota archaeon]|nr:hypothetical protein [Nanoarchaeota archaeon]
MDNNVKTGTTILGIVCKDGVVMAADNRVSIGQSVIVQKDYKKVYPINDYIVFSGCGSATETQQISKLLTAELKLKELRSKKRPSVNNAAGLLSNIQASQSAFILAGFDKDGTSSIFEITGGLSVKIKDYTASVGSGMPYALGYLERMWKPEITVKEGIELAKESIKSSMERDMATGNGMNVFTITKDGIKEVVRDKAETVFTKRE